MVECNIRSKGKEKRCTEVGKEKEKEIAEIVDHYT